MRQYVQLFESLGATGFVVCLHKSDLKKILSAMNIDHNGLDRKEMERYICSQVDELPNILRWLDEQEAPVKRSRQIREKYKDEFTFKNWSPKSHGTYHQKTKIMSEEFISDERFEKIKRRQDLSTALSKILINLNEDEYQKVLEFAQQMTR